MSTREQLLADIERFLTDHDMPHTRFGREAVADVAFVHRLRLGLDPKTATVDRIYAYMARKRAGNKKKPHERGVAA